MYALSAWWGFATSADKKRIEAFVQREAVLFCDGTRQYGVPAPFPAEDMFFSFFDVHGP